MTVSEQLGALAPSRKVSAALAGLVAAFCVLATLVVAGAFTRLDQFAVDHVMIPFTPSVASDHGYAGLFRPFTANTPTTARVLDVLTYPCSVLVSLLVVTCATFSLRRRFGWVVALAPAAAWILGNAIEVVGKGVLTRPHLYISSRGARVLIPGYDDSFPSGHMIRCAVVGAAIVLLWRRAAPWVLAWAAFVGPALVVQDSHVITDVVGGALVGAMLLLLLRAPLEPVFLSGSGTGRSGLSYQGPSGQRETAR